MSTTAVRHESLVPTLLRIRQLTELRADWDSYGASPISATAVTETVLLMEAVAEGGTAATGPAPAPYAVAPLPSGGLQVEWRTETGTIEVEVQTDGRLGYLLESGRGSETIEEEVVDAPRDEVRAAVARVLDR